jgi:hypothetical protein
VPVLEAGQALLEEPRSPLRDDIAPAPQAGGDLIVATPSAYGTDMSMYGARVAQFAYPMACAGSDGLFVS